MSASGSKLRVCFLVKNHLSPKFRQRTSTLLSFQSEKKNSKTAVHTIKSAATARRKRKLVPKVQIRKAPGAFFRKKRFQQDQRSKLFKSLYLPTILKELVFASSGFKVTRFCKCLIFFMIYNSSRSFSNK